MIGQVISERALCSINHRRGETRTSRDEFPQYEPIRRQQFRVRGDCRRGDRASARPGDLRRPRRARERRHHRTAARGSSRHMQRSSLRRCASRLPPVPRACPSLPRVCSAYRDRRTRASSGATCSRAGADDPPPHRSGCGSDRWWLRMHDLVARRRRIPGKAELLAHRAGGREEHVPVVLVRGKRPDG